MKLINRKKKNQIIDFLKTVCYSSCHIQFQLVCHARKSHAIIIKARLVLLLPDSLKQKNPEYTLFYSPKKKVEKSRRGIQEDLCIKGKR